MHAGGHSRDGTVSLKSPISMTNDRLPRALKAAVAAAIFGSESLRHAARGPVAPRAMVGGGRGLSPVVAGAARGSVGVVHVGDDAERGESIILCGGRSHKKLLGDEATRSCWGSSWRKRREEKHHHGGGDHIMLSLIYVG